MDGGACVLKHSPLRLLAAWERDGRVLSVVPRPAGAKAWEEITGFCHAV